MALRVDTTVLRWTDHGLRPGEAGKPSGELLVADSWLVVDGAARAVDAHWARFGGSCATLGVDSAAFRRAATEALPPAGRWFPRVELTAAGLGLRLRPAPAPAAGALSVVVAAPGDPRSEPRRKGPDLDMLRELRERSGAGELLLRGLDGTLREGALSSLLWWEDGVLWTTPAEHTLPGVTRALIVALARERDVHVLERSPSAAELTGREVWLTSALHGIRAVGEWRSPAQPAGRAEQAPDWQSALEAMRESCDARSDAGRS